MLAALHTFDGFILGFVAGMLFMYMMIFNRF
ncbi:hypothetical protein Desti_2636 [Desulfomonile tiedjei DSM 6799]|jgi:hypothetical protein|uniref:Uncharacterized protein n=1 Tax=Desulfomonile tiedjei (strain ATCC 49306 / DSM 6799 / DCB-1) TaxID=706587 RepID=I4C6X4_DESTA|nr:hypothetical protein Desti_2636 [Desulfomonile tiedjei DSM 6799]